MDPVTIPTGPPEHPILDHGALLRQGRAELERLAGDQWTDFNTHDPGITILEALGYVLMDLGYRIFHPIPDLLAEAGPDVSPLLPSPASALTTNAVTPDDLRRVVLDVPGVKNAWIEPVEAPAPPLRFAPAARTVSIEGAQPPPANTQRLAIRGLWRVLVEKSDLEDVNTTTLRLDVARRLHAHRPLCEDFEDIVVLEPMPVVVRASVEIGETEDGERVLLDILRRVDALISPAVRFLTVDEALASGAGVEAVFEGPALTRGFVDPASLSATARRVALHTSDVIREIMAVPGVRAVRSIRLARAGDPEGEPWSLTLDPGGAARLDRSSSRTITLVKERMTVAVDPERVFRAFEAGARVARVFRPLPRARRDLLAPPGRARAVTEYAPLETELPRVYGIGHGALPDSAPVDRVAQANQLRGYLTLFDQLLANEFAQLGHLASLFSAADGSPRSYAARLTGTSDPGRDPVLAPGFGQAELAQLVEPEGSDDAVRRRNRFLNHLLARFAETVTDDPTTTKEVAPPDATPLAARLLDAKRQFLRDVARLGAARGSGVNYLTADPAPPALVDRVRLRLGLPQGVGPRLLVVEHILLRALAEDAVNVLPLLEAASRLDPWSAQLSFVAPTSLRPLASVIERVTREETPAHLAAYLIWLDEGPFAALAAAHDDWLAALRRHRLADRLGADPAAPDPAPEAAP